MLRYEKLCQGIFICDHEDMSSGRGTLTLIAQ
jgi:hypothetical protein